MKPIVVYINENNDKISLTKKEFENKIREKYNTFQIDWNNERGIPIHQLPNQFE